MYMDYFQAESKKFAIYPGEVGLTYAVVGLVGEAGELANKLKKILRGDKTQAEYRRQMIDELGDVLWYVSAVASELDTDLSGVAHNNLTKLRGRLEADTLKGEGDDR